jgi:ribosomal protein S18 acetylase RimI-like enzyme
MTFAVRPPCIADAPEVAELHVSTWREAYSHLLPDTFFSEEYVAGRHKMWEHVLSHPTDGVVVRVAESEGKIIGFAWVGPGTGREGEEPPRVRQLYAIYVAATHYGSGAAQALLDQALGDSGAMLWVAKENPRATAFYLRNGFHFDGTEQIDSSAPAMTAARMVR